MHILKSMASDTTPEKSTYPYENICLLQVFHGFFGFIQHFRYSNRPSKDYAVIQLLLRIFCTMLRLKETSVGLHLLLAADKYSESRCITKCHTFPFRMHKIHIAKSSRSAIFIIAANTYGLDLRNLRGPTKQDYQGSHCSNCHLAITA
jgi:hypothetical protein